MRTAYHAAGFSRGWKASRILASRPGFQRNIQSARFSFKRVCTADAGVTLMKAQLTQETETLRQQMFAKSSRRISAVSEYQQPSILFRVRSAGDRTRRATDLQRSCRYRRFTGPELEQECCRAAPRFRARVWRALRRADRLSPWLRPDVIAARSCSRAENRWTTCSCLDPTMPEYDRQRRH